MATIVYKVHECEQRREKTARETEEGGECEKSKQGRRRVWYADLSVLVSPVSVSQSFSGEFLQLL